MNKKYKNFIIYYKYYNENFDIWVKWLDRFSVC